MEDYQKINLIKELENLVAFQKDCLNAGNMEDYDKIANRIERLEDMISNS